MYTAIKIYNDGMKSTEHYLTYEMAKFTKRFYSNHDTDVKKVIIIPTCILKKNGWNDFEEL